MRHISSRNSLSLAAALMLGLAAHSPGLAQDAGSLPAVGGINANLSVEGGAYDNDEAVLALGSMTIPAGHAWGIQLDGAAGSIDGEPIVGGGFHAFNRNPDSHLVGVFASHHDWKDYQISRIAAESELYWIEFTLRALIGLEHIRYPARIGPMLLTDRDDGHVFGKADLVWYPTEDLELFGGFHYESEAPLGAVGMEYRFARAQASRIPYRSSPWAISAKTTISGRPPGCGSTFGDGGRSLRQIRREIDPPNHTPVSPALHRDGLRAAQQPPDPGIGLYPPTAAGLV
jgi:hypothetical protein